MPHSKQELTDALTYTTGMHTSPKQKVDNYYNFIKKYQKLPIDTIVEAAQEQLKTLESKE